MIIYVTLANFGERFLLRSNQFMLRKIFFIDKLLLTFFFFVQNLIATFALSSLCHIYVIR